MFTLVYNIYSHKINAGDYMLITCITFVSVAVVYQTIVYKNTGMGRRIRTCYVMMMIVVCICLVSNNKQYLNENNPKKMRLLSSEDITSQNGSTHCRKVQFLPKKVDLTYLVSFPGSGNTWVRHLLQQATGK